MGGADFTVFRWLNGQAGDHTWLDHLGKFAATEMQLVIVATLIVGWLLALGVSIWRDRRVPRGLVTVVLVAGIALGLGLLADQIIGHFWSRDRPYATHANAHLIEPPSSDPSFPSDHATAGFAFTFGVMAQLPLLAAILLVETVLMSLGRVFVGLHYPGDVVGSLLVATAATLVASFIVARAAVVIDWALALANAQAERWGWSIRFG